MNQKKLFTDVNNNMKILFGDKLKKIFLYGSYARKKQNKESDIDFFILVDDSEENLRDARYKISDVMSDLSLNYDILVSITEDTVTHFQKFKDILPFYKNINKEGIEIYGK